MLHERTLARGGVALVTDARDYLSAQHASLAREGDGTRLDVRGRSVLFGDIAPDALRRAANDATRVAVAHYAANVERARLGDQVSATHVEEAALDVVVHELAFFVRANRGPARRRVLTTWFTHADWDAGQPREQLLSYCERTFGLRYQTAAAAFVGLPLAEFAAWERERRAFWDRW